jgi:hypothetical protein
MCDRLASGWPGIVTTMDKTKDAPASAGSASPFFMVSSTTQSGFSLSHSGAVERFSVANGTTYVAADTRRPPASL